MGELAARLGPGPAEVILLTKGGLRGRSPAEFFYGFPGLLRGGVDARMQSTSAPYPGAVGSAHRFAERIWARLTGISRRKHFLDCRRSDWRDARLIMGFTDHFSLTLGDYFRSQPRRPFTIGLFHGLSDYGRHLTPLGRRLAGSYVRRALGGLDHVAFMSPADREQAMARYGLAEANTSVFHFGVDTAFWTPSGGSGGEFNVLAVGSDPNRDYGTLLAAEPQCPVHIVTNHALPASSVTVTRGDFFQSPVSDEALRDLYRRAGVVVIPIHDVFQPSGQSVALQAMACGRPVILSRSKGLWAPELLVDGENCLLVAPGDPHALSSAIAQVMNDGALSQRLGASARDTVEAHFSLAPMERCLAALVALP